MTEQDKIEIARREAKKMFVYFSRLLDRPVEDKNGRKVGQIYDIILKPAAVYPQSQALIIRKGFPNRVYSVIDWKDVAAIQGYHKECRLLIEGSALKFEEIHDNRKELTLRRDILDQQVVDTHNHKVIRVNDIHLLSAENLLMAAHVDIGLRGIIRRLGFEKIVDLLVRLFNKDAFYLTHEDFISWKYIQPLTVNPASMTIKIDVPQQQFANIPGADLGEIFLDLSSNQQKNLFKSLDLKNRSRIFSHIDFKTQRSLVYQLDNKETIELLNNIPSDEITDFLEQLPKDKAKQYLMLMESKYAKKLSELLGYSSDSAGGLMTTEYISFLKDTPIEGALNQIKARAFKVEPAQFIYIIDAQGQLVGCTNLRRMIISSPADPIEAAAFPKIYSVHPDSSVKEVAYLMEKYKYYTIPVVNEDNILQGIVTVDDVLSQVIAIAWRRLKKIKAKPQVHSEQK